MIDGLQRRDFSRLIAVGDRVLKDITESDAEVDLSIVDGSIQREEHFEDIAEDRDLSPAQGSEMEKLMKRVFRPSHGFS